MGGENLRSILEIIGSAVTFLVTVRSLVSIVLKARQNMAALKAGADPKSLPPIDERPLVWAVLAAGALAYWFSAHPKLAQRVLPSAESAELATAEAAKPRKTASISRSVCTSSKDCPSGQGCDRGRCSVPRKLSELKDGANCAGCESLPWMEAPAPALALR